MKAKRSRTTRNVEPRAFPLSILIGGVVLLLIGAVIFIARRPGPSVAIEVTGAPSLKVDQASIDLGDIKLGKTVMASFALSNVGDQPLQLTRTPYIEVIEGC